MINLFQLIYYKILWNIRAIAITAAAAAKKLINDIKPHITVTASFPRIEITTSSHIPLNVK